jgi:hypothetical protein
VSRSGEGIDGPGDGMRVLVLSVCGGIIGIGGTRAYARVVPMRRAPGDAACPVLSRVSRPDVAVTRVVAEEARFEGTGAVRDEGVTRTAGDCADGVPVDPFVR